jgi:formylglycine-generating enzyme required for sulfatase activity
MRISTEARRRRAERREEAALQGPLSQRIWLIAGGAVGVAAVVVWVLQLHIPSDEPTVPPIAEPAVAAQAPAAAHPKAPASASQAPATKVPLSLDRERVLKPNDSFRECDHCPEVVVVPAGAFTMGSPNSEKDRFNNEGPQRRVIFDWKFAVGKFAVTFDEWDACVADGGCNGYRPPDEGWGRGRRPVINVSLDDAKSYVSWLSNKSGKTYRILSEAEREYVTRAGTTTPFWWGGSISTQQANYDGNYTYGGPKGEYRRGTLPVDSFQPNPWGLYQVHGNVYEWTEDCYHGSYNGAPSDGSAWITGDDCGRRVVRGGSWHTFPQELRSANRNGNSIVNRGDDLGFRVGRALTP